MEMIDAERFVFRLKSCTYNQADGQIYQKGGKYTAFHDGISFYYTVIDPVTENFELKATFTVDYINPTADGQEGFGLLALDSLGAHGVSSANHYTNSAGIIAPPSSRRRSPGSRRRARIPLERALSQA